MSNSIQTFRAATAEDALAQVRRELGLNAVVVEVKQVSSGGMFAWLSSRQQFEVQASRPAKSRRTTRSSTSQPQTTAPSNVGTIAAAAAASKSLNSTAVNDSELAPPPPLLPELSLSRNRITAAFDLPAPARPESWQNLAIEVVRGMSSSADDRPASVNCPDWDRNTAQSIEERLDVLQHMIADLGRRSQPRGLVEIPPELFPHYLTLVEADVEDELARELIQNLHRHAAPEQLADTAATMALLTALVEQRIPCDRSLTVLQSKRSDRGAISESSVAGRRQIAMVVGPTGVGKTTTLAKLAGHFGVREGCRLGLITVDTYRVAAVEQLRTYAEIIDLPMRVVADAAEMQEALDAFADCDLVLIDTAGRSPHDDRRLTELKQLIDAVCPDHVYLVLSLASGSNALRAAAERFATVRPTSLVITKLDEATGCGGLLSVARDIGLPISYFTTGQEVPRDIEPANPCRAARLIVGTGTLNRCVSEKVKVLPRS